jgi:hypothetical protein
MSGVHIRVVETLHAIPCRRNPTTQVDLYSWRLLFVRKTFSLYPTSTGVDREKRVPSCRQYITTVFFFRSQVNRHSESWVETPVIDSGFLLDRVPNYRRTQVYWPNVHFPTISTIDGLCRTVVIHSSNSGSSLTPHATFVSSVSSNVTTPLSAQSSRLLLT